MFVLEAIEKIAHFWLTLLVVDTSFNSAVDCNANGRVQESSPSNQSAVMAGELLLSFECCLHLDRQKWINHLWCARVLLATIKVWAVSACS